MGDKFEYFKFKNFQNPFGILFHPLAIERLVEYALNDKEYISTDIFVIKVCGILLTRIRS